MIKQKQLRIFNILKRKTDLTKEIKLSKSAAKRIFLVFSLLLVFDLFVLPVVSSTIEGTYKCEYDLITCIFLSFAPLLVLGIFWYLVWLGIYESFFMTDGEQEKMKNSRFFLVRLKMRNTSYVSDLHGKDFVRRQSIIIAAVFCLGIGYFFVLELYHLIKILVRTFI